jgi:polyhydroxyalkanoate synthesis regulator phasin
MTTVRDAIERTILLSVGAASLTRERAEAVVADFVRRGELAGDEARAMVDRLMTRVRGESAQGSGLIDRLEGGLRGALREVGVVTRAELEDVLLRLAELEHRLRLLEEASAPPATEPASPPDPPSATA